MRLFKVGDEFEIQVDALDENYIEATPAEYRAYVKENPEGGRMFEVWGDKNEKGVAKMISDIPMSVNNNNGKK